MSSAIMSTYKRLPVSFVRGTGAWVESSTGEQYLDALSGIAVCGLGHAHPRVAAALAEQSTRLIHTSNLYGIPHQEALAEKLCALSGLEQVFFSNSGAEANEAAIKLARRFGHAAGKTRPEIIVAENAFHGRTLAALAATGNVKAQEGFGPMPEGFVRAPYNDVAAVSAAGSDQTVAVFVEPIQGEGGIVVPDHDYLTRLRALCDERGWLLMLDEVQSGVGRTGQWFAHQHAGIKPDVITLAKALANGVPIGACIAGGPAADVLGPGSHGSTFGGNPLSCAAGLAVCDVIAEENLTERATALGKRLKAGFTGGLKNVQKVREIRSCGLMIGIELTVPCAELVTQALKAHLLINVTAGSVVRLLPPLILTDAEADQIVSTLVPLIEAINHAD